MFPVALFICVAAIEARIDEVSPKTLGEPTKLNEDYASKGISDLFNFWNEKVSNPSSSPSLSPKNATMSKGENQKVSSPRAILSDEKRTIEEEKFQMEPTSGNTATNAESKVGSLINLWQSKLTEETEQKSPSGSPAATAAAPSNQISSSKINDRKNDPEEKPTEAGNNAEKPQEIPSKKPRVELNDIQIISLASMVNFWKRIAQAAKETKPFGKVETTSEKKPNSPEKFEKEESSSPKPQISSGWWRGWEPPAVMEEELKHPSTSEVRKPTFTESKEKAQSKVPSKGLLEILPPSEIHDQPEIYNTIESVWKFINKPTRIENQAETSIQSTSEPMNPPIFPEPPTEMSSPKVVQNLDTTNEDVDDIAVRKFCHFIYVNAWFPVLGIGRLDKDDDGCSKRLKSWMQSKICGTVDGKVTTDGIEMCSEYCSVAPFNYFRKSNSLHPQCVPVSIAGNHLDTWMCKCDTHRYIGQYVLSDKFYLEDGELVIPFEISVKS